MLTGTIVCAMVAMATAFIPPPNFGSTCAATLCRIGTTCVEEWGRARCVANTKPGRCPPVTLGQVGLCAAMCRSDSECRGQDKCCPTACGRTSCTAPVVEPVAPTCATTKCRPGDVCKMIKRCRLCPLQPVCVRRPVDPVPVWCPKFSPFLAWKCPRYDKCSKTNPCRFPKQCCPHPCGYHCVTIYKG